MSAGARIGAFVAALVLLFGGAALAGGAIKPHGDDPRPATTNATIMRPPAEMTR